MNRPGLQRTAYLEAINEAGDLINADFARYKHYIVEPVKDGLKREELGSHFIRYAPSRTVDEAHFSYTYEWMQSWNLTTGESKFEALVAG